MSVKTKKEFCQEVLYEVYGGMPPSDARITERFVLTKLNDTIANFALVNAYEKTNLEGITYADDTFYVRFNNVALSDDSASGDKVATLPSMPVGLPSQRSITITPANVNSDPSLIKMIERHEVARMKSSSRRNPVKNIYMWIVGNKLYGYINKNMFPLLELPAINLDIATADGGLTSDLNMPQGMIATAKTNIVAELKKSLMMPQDIKNDGQEIKEAQA
jgi:hypothetical protein